MGILIVAMITAFGAMALLRLYSLHHSLQTIPAAHWSCRYSRIFILYKRWCREENQTLLRLHKKLGSPILLSPTEISVNDIESLRTVYGGWEKAEWYSVFSNYQGTPNMFTMLDSRSHAEQKKKISAVYARSNVLNSKGFHRVNEDVIKGELLPLLKKRSQCKKAIEIGEILGRMALDAMSAFIFGRDSGTRVLADKHKWNELQKHHSQRGRWAFYMQEMPSLERTFGFQNRCSRTARSWIDSWCMQLYESSERLEAEDAILPGEAEVWRSVRRATYLDNGESRRKERVCSELLDHLLAGHETTSIALTYCLYHLSANPQLQEALRVEISKLGCPFRMENDYNIPSVRSVDELPLLSAIITETLRLNSPIPGPQPRVTPERAYIKGHGPLPKGVRISANALCLHRNEKVYQRAYEWDPTRWLMNESTQGEINEAKEMRRWWWAFGSGGRMCIGKNFSELTMKMTLTAIYTNFETQIVDASGIEQMDGYTVGPKNDIKINFLEIQN